MKEISVSELKQMMDNHGLILCDSELEDICQVVMKQSGACPVRRSVPEILTAILAKQPVTLADGRVRAFAEKQVSAGAGWINAGLYHLDPAPFRAWDGAAFSLETTMLPQWAAAGRLGAVAVDADFIDIGVPDDYFRFCRWVDAGQRGDL